MANSALKTPGIATFLREQILNLVQQEFPESRIVDTSVKRINRGLEFVYQSAIALQLAALTGQNAFQIANLIDHRWRTGIDQPETVPDMKNMKKRFRLEIQPSGMMLFKLLPDGVADWLQTMTQDPQSNSFPNFEVASPTQNQSQNPAQFAMIPLGRKNSKPGSTNFHSTNFHSTNFHSTKCSERSAKNISRDWFYLQYSHARCCSLLRLGHREGLIVLSQPDPPVVPVLWSVVEPCPFPWLNRDHHLCFQNAAEHEMITTLFTVLELRHCSSVSKAQWEKLARQLSQAFWVFYSQCQVLGEVKQGFPWLAQARLGLMLIAQSSSYFLLQEKLGICAPLEL